MDPLTVRGIVSKQLARNILAKQTRMVRDMVREGLLTSADADFFLKEISNDAISIEKMRNEMYRDQSKRAATNVAQSEQNSQLSSSLIGGSLLVSLLSENSLLPEKNSSV